MRKNTKILLIALASLIILIATVYFTMIVKTVNNEDAADKQISDDKAKVVIDKKNELSFNISDMDIDEQRKDCEDRGGIFNSCGGSCDSSGICLDVCVPVCTLKKETYEKNIKVVSPKILESVNSPFKVSGEARGNWFFENQFTVILTDWDGKIITEAVASGYGDWLTEDFIPFEAELEFEIPDNLYSSRANLILLKNNPSGLPENDDSLEYVIYLDK